MNIKLKNIAPHPLIGAFSPSTDIWGKAITIEKASKVIILAPSGSGKTTLVSLLYGLRKDFDGELFFNDESTSVFNIDKWSDIRSNSIAVVFQDLQLLADLTAMENIVLKNQLTNQFSRAKIEEMANQLGVQNPFFFEYPSLNQNCVSYFRDLPSHKCIQDNHDFPLQRKPCV
jgi:putative ABC transport system ATP-binding protein